MRKLTSLLTLLLLFTAMAFGQTRLITGTVTDEKGDPPPGASVRIKGTTTGVAADNNGQFCFHYIYGESMMTETCK